MQVFAVSLQALPAAHGDWQDWLYRVERQSLGGGDVPPLRLFKQDDFHVVPDSVRGTPRHSHRARPRNRRGHGLAKRGARLTLQRRGRRR